MKVIAKGIVARSTQRRGNYWPSVARLAGGRLAAVWSGGRRNHICPFGRLCISYSGDEGRHWSPEAILFDTPLDDRDGGILSWKGRAVVTTFNNTREFQRQCLAKWPDNRPAGEAELIRAYLATVTDEEESNSLGSWLLIGDGERFEKPQKMPITAPHGPIVGPRGELLYIGRAFMNAPQPPLAEGIYWMASEDGSTWSQPVKAPEAPGGAFLCEPHGFACKDGSVFVAARAREGEGITLYFNRIRGGKFGAWSKSGICGAPAHFLRLADGRVLMTYGRREAPFGIRAKVSADDGLHWGEELVLTDDGVDWDLGYPASVSLLNGNILTVWYQYLPQDRLASIFFAEWEI